MSPTLTTPGLVATLLALTLARADILKPGSMANPTPYRLPTILIEAAAGPPPVVEDVESAVRDLARNLELNGCAAVDHRAPLRGRIDAAVVRAAAGLLDLPMGAGRLLEVNGKSFLFCLEYHYHEPGFTRGPEGWHKGVTVYSTT